MRFTIISKPPKGRSTVKKTDEVVTAWDWFAYFTRTAPLQRGDHPRPPDGRGGGGLSATCCVGWQHGLGHSAIHNITGYVRSLESQVKAYQAAFDKRDRQECVIDGVHFKVVAHTNLQCVNGTGWSWFRQEPTGRWQQIGCICHTVPAVAKTEADDV